MANGMAGLFVGASGLKTAQTALNTTAHNLSNINTTGYTRQQVTFSDTTYVNVNSKDKVSYASYGLGVAISEVRRIRDQYIDLAYRNENSRLGFYESQYNAVQEIADQFGSRRRSTKALISFAVMKFRLSLNSVSLTPPAAFPACASQGSCRK